jgi:hypothetical protein
VADITLKQLIGRAYELIERGWAQGEYYVSDVVEKHGDFEGELLTENHRPQITSVCSVGAMRLAFAELVGAPISQAEDWDPQTGEYFKYDYVDETVLISHPLYKEGMKVLGKAFYEDAQLSALLDGQGLGRAEKEWLLNGEGGRHWDEGHVEGAIIEINDSGNEDKDTLRKEILAAFKRAAEQASDEVTEEAFGDVPTGTVTS